MEAYAALIYLVYKVDLDPVFCPTRVAWTRLWNKILNVLYIVAYAMLTVQGCMGKWQVNIVQCICFTQQTICALDRPHQQYCYLLLCLLNSVPWAPKEWALFYSTQDFQVFLAWFPWSLTNPPLFSRNLDSSEKVETVVKRDRSFLLGQVST